MEVLLSEAPAAACQRCEGIGTDLIAVNDETWGDLGKIGELQPRKSPQLELKPN